MKTKMKDVNMENKSNFNFTQDLGVTIIYALPGSGKSKLIKVDTARRYSDTDSAFSTILKSKEPTFDKTEAGPIQQAFRDYDTLVSDAAFRFTLAEAFFHRKAYSTKRGVEHVVVTNLISCLESYLANLALPEGRKLGTIGRVIFVVPEDLDMYIELISSGTREASIKAGYEGRFEGKFDQILERIWADLQTRLTRISNLRLSVQSKQDKQKGDWLKPSLLDVETKLVKMQRDEFLTDAVIRELPNHFKFSFRHIRLYYSRMVKSSGKLEKLPIAIDVIEGSHENVTFDFKNELLTLQRKKGMLTSKEFNHLGTLSLFFMSIASSFLLNSIVIIDIHLALEMFHSDEFNHSGPPLREFLNLNPGIGSDLRHQVNLKEVS